MTGGILPFPGTPVPTALGADDQYKFLFPLFPKDLRHQPGAYLVIVGYGGGWNVIDVGRADDVRLALLAHGNWACWDSISRLYGPLTFAIEAAPFSANMQEQLAQRVRGRCGQLPYRQ